MELINSTKQYKTSENLMYSCQYHVIFCPKYRRPVLVNGADERAKELFLEIAESKQFEILDMEVMPDHVHMIIDCNPQFGIMECVKALKRNSSRKLRDEFPHIKQKIPTLWTRGVFISSVGSVSLETVKKYIDSQKGV